VAAGRGADKGPYRFHPARVGGGSRPAAAWGRAAPGPWVGEAPEAGGWAGTVWGGGRGRWVAEIEMVLRVGVDGHGTGAEAGRAGGRRGRSLRVRCPANRAGGCRGRDGLGAGRQVERVGGGRRLKLPGWGLGRLRTVCMKELSGAEVGDTVRSRRAGEIGCFEIGHGAGGAEDLAGGWRERAGDSSDVTGQVALRCGGRAGSPRGAWEAPDGAHERAGRRRGSAARSGAVGGDLGGSGRCA
jgi:hypothetical protein